MKIDTKIFNQNIVNQVLVFILFLFASVCTSQENNLPSNNVENHHLTVVTEELPPFQYVENNKVVGFATDIIALVLKSLPYDHEIILYPWSRAYKLALTKKNTCIYSIARTEDRENSFIWIDSFTERSVSFIGLSTNKNIAINTIEDAKKYRVAVIKDDAYHQILLNNGFTESENMFIVNNTHSMLKLLKQRDNIDLVLEDPFTINFNAKKSKLDPADFKSFFQINKEPLDYYFACQVGTDPAMLENLKNAFKSIKASGELDAIKAKWRFN